MMTEQKPIGSLSSHSTIPHPPGKTGRWWIEQFGHAGLLFAIGVLLIFLLGVAQRIGWVVPARSTVSTAVNQGGTQVYTCPMHPQIRQPQPGRCPICGMSLVPATSTGADLDQWAVRIEPAQRRLANIQTEEVKVHPVSITINTIGAIQIDESRQATIASYIDGRVERIFADYTGVEVDQGDHLAVVYSPQLYAAQVEYIEAKKTLGKDSGGALAAVREAQTKLVANSRHRLVELGMTEEQLAELESSNKPQSRLTIFSPIGGTVIEKFAEEGKYLSAGEPIYRIANLSTIWLMLELYPEDASRIRFGQIVEAELTSQLGEVLVGRVAFIDPKVNMANRTVGVRVEFKNDQGQLRPGDYAKASIDIPIGPQGDVYDKALAGKWISPMHPQVIRDEPGDCPICGMKLVPTARFGYVEQPVSQPGSVVVPRSALLMAGEHSVVYVETEPGRFELRNVILGPILKNEAIILGGVKPGEKVATSGNFLIDSQMQLAGKPSLIDPTRFVPPKTEDTARPLQFADITVKQVGGPAGEQLEQFYRAYFEIQNSLSRDEVPTDKAVSMMLQRAKTLADSPMLAEEVQRQFVRITNDAAHLHHLILNEARVKFKSISQVVVTLATEVRGAQAIGSFKHFFCPMVKHGNGDWLQADEQVSNPYLGSEMLRCGELVHIIPAAALPGEPVLPGGKSSGHSNSPQEGAK